MNTLRKAVDFINEETARRAGRVDQVDAVVCEDGKAIAFCVFDGLGDMIVANVDLPPRIWSGPILLQEWKEAFARGLAMRAPSQANLRRR